MKRSFALIASFALAMVVGACENTPSTGVTAAPEFSKREAPLKDSAGADISCTDNSPCIKVIPGPDIAGGPVYEGSCKLSTGKCIAALDATNCGSSIDVVPDSQVWPVVCGGTPCLNNGECNDGKESTQDICLNLGWADYGLCYHPGTECFLGKGQCVASGTWVLKAGGGTECSAIPGMPTNEVCDGLDNDCDGVTDEDGTADCTTFYTDADADGHGVAPSKCMCVASATYPVANYDDCNDADCVVYAGASELCDGKDNDCNGLTDEGYGTLGQACADGTGECFVTGTIVCAANGQSSQCSVQAKAPNTEICDDKDNDCDGLTDEDCDNDGDGYCNEAMGTIGKPAACPKGGGDCNDGNLNRFPGQVEKCNALDDDCDGATDEGFNLGQTCNVGVGECANSGVLICAQDGLSSVCSVSPKPAATAEKCDNVDDDCDGLTDEGCDDDGDGYCDAAMAVMVTPGFPLICQKGNNDCNDNSAAINPGAIELCNGVDDNCEGTADEGFDLNAVCSVGTGECKSWGAIVCAMNGTAICSAVPKVAGTETCNGKDDNCDGVVDDGNICSPANTPVPIACGTSVDLNTATDLNAANNFLSWEIGGALQSRLGKEMVLKPLVANGQSYVLTCVADVDSPTKWLSYAVYLLKSLSATPDKDTDGNGIKETGSAAMVATAGTKSVPGTGGVNNLAVLDTKLLTWKGKCSLTCGSVPPN